MLSLLRVRTFLIMALCATVCAVLFVIQKTDTLNSLRLFASATPLYVGLCAVVVWAIGWAWRRHADVRVRAFTVASALLPASLLIVAAPFYATTHIADAITALVGLHIGIWGLLAIACHTPAAARITTAPAARITPWQWIILGVVTLLYGGFAFYNLGNAFYVDERLWVYDRIENYWDNIIERDWINTRPSDKPGITTALVTGPGLMTHDPSDFKKGKLHKDLLPDMFFALRAPQVCVILCMIIGAFFLARRIIGTRTALLFTIFLALSPLLLGISRIINPDALLWIFFILGFLCVMRYVSTQQPRAIYAAGVLLGFALLTKYIANIFILFFILIIFADLALRDRRADDTVPLAQHIRTRAIHGAAMVWIALCVFYIFYPGAWVKHDRMLLATIYSEAFASTWKFFAAIALLVYADIFFLRARVVGAILSFVHRIRTLIACIIYGIVGIAVLLVFGNVLTGMSFYDMIAIIESPKSAYTNHSPFTFFLTSFYPLIFGVTPVVLVGALVAYARRAYRVRWQTADRIVLYSAAFILIYYAASLLNHVAPIIRYQITLYPLIILAAAIGWNDIIRMTRLRNTAIIAVCGAMVCISGIQLASIAPFYFSYNSALLPQRFTINTKDMGDGNYDIAQWLNALPDAATKVVWTDKSGVCQFFVGTCINMSRGDALVAYAPHIDYYVVSQNRRGFFQRTSDAYRAANADYPLHIDRLYADDLPTVYTLHPNGRPDNFMRVIDGHTVSILSDDNSL